ncbi:MAG TPA: hypothetical protein VK589_13310 [Chryseolinea sp.]|nr:hypothetical protein [Chryseolinea sp.]
MKTTLLLIIFTCGCNVFAYSQINQKRKKDVAPDNLSNFNPDSLSSFNYDPKPVPAYKKMIKPEGFQDDAIDERFMPNDGHWTGKTQRDAFEQESMPVYKPEGEFSIKVIKPDTTRKYSMPVKKY